MGSQRADPEGKLAIIAGRDALPRLIAEHRRAAGLPYLVISFDEEAAPWIGAHPHEVHQFEKAGRLLAALRAAGCGHVVFAGAMERPKLKPWRADGKTVALMGKVMALLARGDDGLLSGLAANRRSSATDSRFSSKSSAPSFSRAGPVLNRVKNWARVRLTSQSSAVTW